MGSSNKRELAIIQLSSLLKRTADSPAVNRRTAPSQNASAAEGDGGLHVVEAESSNSFVL